MAQQDIVNLLSEAPVSEHYGCKMAYYCHECPWWTENSAKASKNDIGVLHCPECKGALRPIDLEYYLSSHQHSLDPDKFKQFLECRAGGAHWVDKAP